MSNLRDEVLAIMPGATVHASTDRSVHVDVMKLDDGRYAVGRCKAPTLDDAFDKWRSGNSGFPPSPLLRTVAATR